MATKNFTISIDALISLLSGSTSVGAGADDHLPVGKGTGSTTPVRSLLKFNLDWTGVATITSAQLKVYRTSYHGSIVSPSFYIKRVTSTWSEGTRGSDEAWYADNAVEWSNQPSTTSTDHVQETSAASGWNTYDITDIVKAWAPTSIPGGGNQTNYGIMLKYSSANSSTNDEVAGHYAEFESREHSSGHDPYILLTYGTNTVPNAPTLNSPVAGALVSSQTPTLNFTPHDDQGDNHTAYTYEVDNNSDFSSPVESTEVTGTFTDATPINRVVTTSLTRGTTYYWRVKTKDATGYGAWSSGESFKIAQLPTATIVQPGSAQTGELYYVAGSGVSPRLKARWTYNCPDGHAQTQVIVKIYADSAGSPGSLLYTGTYNGAELFFETAYAATNGTYYHVSLQPTCSLGVQGNETSKNRTRVRWGRASYYFDTGGGLLSLSAQNTQTKSGNQDLIIEYTTSTGIASEPTTWYATPGEAGLNRYIWHRVTLFGWGSSPTSPSLNSLTWTYSTTTPTAEKWTLATGASVDTGTRFYGSQSLLHTTNATTQKTYQVVDIEPNKTYILSGRIKTQGDPVASLRLIDAGDGTTTLVSVAATAGTDWTKYATATWYSGSNTQVRIECRTADTGSGDKAWFDALKLEASTVVTPWTPGFIGGAVVMDAGGMMVDAFAGGVWRLRGSTGGTRDVIELGANGIKFGGSTSPVEVSSPASNLLQADGQIRVTRTNGTDLAYAGKRTADSNPRWTITADGTWGLYNSPGDANPVLRLRNNGGTATVEMGAGGGTAVDANLYRAAADLLETADIFNAVAGLQINGNDLAYYVAADSATPISNSTYTTYSDVVFEMTGLPADVVQYVLLGILMKSSTLSGSPGINLEHYSVISNNRPARIYANVAGGWITGTAIIKPGGTNGRQGRLQFFNTSGSPTFTVYVWIHGYWRLA